MQGKYVVMATASVATVLLIVTGHALAGNSDPMCEGLRGAAFGLCTAALAVGCDDPALGCDSSACAHLEDNFRRTTGDEPPWTQPGCCHNSDCFEGDFCQKPDGACGGLGACETQPQGACPEFLDPVCGCDGVTYANPCYASVAGASIDYRGECE
jgi:hypothetical protein